VARTDKDRGGTSTTALCLTPYLTLRIRWQDGTASYGPQYSGVYHHRLLAFGVSDEHGRIRRWTCLFGPQGELRHDKQARHFSAGHEGSTKGRLASCGQAMGLGMYFTTFTTWPAV